MRGPGLVSAVFITENVLEHIAEYLNIDSALVRVLFFVIVDFVFNFLTLSKANKLLQTKSSNSLWTSIKYIKMYYYTNLHRNRNLNTTTFRLCGKHS